VLAAGAVEDVLEGLSMPFKIGEPDAAAIGFEPMARH